MTASPRHGVSTGARPARAGLAALTLLVVAGIAALCGPTGCAREAAGGRSLRVVIHAFAYDPAQLAVAPGDTVTWVNEDIVPHTATAAGRAWDTGSIGPDSTARVVIAARDVEPYGCTFHPQMKGLLTRR